MAESSKAGSKIAERAPMARPGLGMRGQSISLLSNHFKVIVGRTDCHFYQYSVSINYEDGTPVDAKGVGRKVLDKLHETYSTELSGMDFAYDGEKTLFTIGALPQTKLEFKVILEDRPLDRKSSPGADHGSPSESDRKRSRRQAHMKTYIVAIKYATKIPIMAIANAIRGQDSEQFQEAVRVLDVILRQHASKQGCLLVRQSFFHNQPANFVPLGGGINACRGIHSSFRATQSGLSLNMDVTTTMTIKPGPVVDFLMENQSVRHPNDINWDKAKRTLKNLRVKAVNTNLEYKIRGLSDQTCSRQTFSMRRRTGGNEGNEVELTVFEYFERDRNIKLKYSGDFPCIDVGKPKRPTYIPIELCSLVSLQRYTKAMTNLQRAALVEKSRQKPHERMGVLKQAFNSSQYEANPLLGSSGLAISREFTRVEGRVLTAPQLKVGGGDSIIPRNGRWNFNSKRLIDPFRLQRWAVVNFSARCDMRRLSGDLVRCAQMKGMAIDAPFCTIDESPQVRRSSPLNRVQDMVRQIREKLPGPPQFLLCILPDRKNSELYGPWKRTNLSEIGIPTQCISPPPNVKDQYLTNLLLKINSKLGGINSLLTLEQSYTIPMVSKVPTLIIGMDVSHGSPGRSDVPSVAAVVNSRQWPLISRYRATVRTQAPKTEMIDNLFNIVNDKDEGIVRELLEDFYKSTKQQIKPEHIIIFRDGVSESQFRQVLNNELDQIIKACKFMDPSWNPKFTLIVAQKNHHTKFFQPNSQDNVPPGTVVDNGVCHPKNYDFYMCSQAGMIGTTRPTHYHVLHDEIGFSPDDLQALVHSLSYVYQRSTTAISVVAPICYAHLAAAQMSQFIKFEDSSDRASSLGGEGNVPAVPQLPKLHERVSSSMFFC